MARAFAEISFTPSVRKIQEKNGSATAYAKALAPDIEGGNLLTDRETSFIKQRDGFYQATISETGWPYVQFRGGPRGFLNVLDPSTIAYADFRGNRQYLSVGNLSIEKRISLILMDYPNRRRLKIWGRALITDISDNPAFIEQLHDPSYPARPERTISIAVEAFDWNCPAHIPQRYTMDEIELIRQHRNKLKDDNAI